MTLVGSPGYRVLVDAGARRRELAFIPRAEPGYMHSFALTRRYVVLFEQPFVVDPASFLSPARKPIIENYRWEGSQPSRIIVVDRRAGGVRATVELDPFFVFHHVNATERGDRITLDVCAHKDSTIIDALYLKRLRKAEQRIPRVRVRRIDVDPARSTASVRDLSDVDLELPRIHYARVSQRDHRYVYGIGMRTPASPFTDQLVKLDAHTGTHRTWHERLCYPGEPVFVPAPGARREDDGVVLSVVLDAGRGTSFLLVLDAPTMSERARAAVPHHIPFGFHGMHVAA